MNKTQRQALVALIEARANHTDPGSFATYGKFIEALQNFEKSFKEEPKPQDRPKIPVSFSTVTIDENTRMVRLDSCLYTLPFSLTAPVDLTKGDDPLTIAQRIASILNLELK